MTDANPSGGSTPPLGRLLGMVALGVMFAAGGVILARLAPFPQLRFAIQRTPQAMPSSTLVPPKEVARGLPLLSIHVNDADLYDPDFGIIANVSERGRDWERAATISYYEGGRLRFASGVGLRIHGGLSRTLSPQKSFRLYFGRKYGADRLGGGVLFDGRLDPIRRLVVHNDARADRTGLAWHFVNPLAYDITRRIGAYAPYTQPVRLFLNGEWKGSYVLTEHVRDNMIPKLLVPRFGHANFAVTNRSYRELRAWVGQNEPLDMQTIGKRIDIDNLTRWFLAVLFCGTEDAFQGAQLLNLNDPDGRWFWINWDMDHSFMDYNQQAIVPWEHDTFHTTLERMAEAPQGWRTSEVRSLVLTTLLAEDEEYREYFKRTFVEVMNHRLTPAFLRERFTYYASLGRQMGLEGADSQYLDPLGEFLQRRPGVLRDQAEVYLNTRPSHRVVVRGLGNGRGTVDGTPVPDDFQGFYFPDMTMTLTASPAEGFRHWLVDGQIVNSARISRQVDRNLEIEAVFQ